MRQVVEPDPYEVLGVAPAAPVDVVRAAWRVGVKRYHPDHAPAGLVEDYTRRTRELNIARDLLCDPARRRDYDASRPVEPVPDVEEVDIPDFLRRRTVAAPVQEQPAPAPVPVAVSRRYWPTRPGWRADPVGAVLWWSGTAYVAWWAVWLAMYAVLAIISAALS